MGRYTASVYRVVYRKEKKVIKYSEHHKSNTANCGFGKDAHYLWCFQDNIDGPLRSGSHSKFDLSRSVSASGLIYSSHESSARDVLRDPALRVNTKNYNEVQDHKNI